MPNMREGEAWKVRKDPHLGLEEETLRNRSGPEVEEWRARMKGNVRVVMGTGTREGRMECQVGEMED